MAPTFSVGALTVWTFVDANALIDYIRECALHEHGFAPTGRRADALRVRLDLTLHPFVPKTAGDEARRNMKKDLVQKLGYEKAMTVMSCAEELLDKYCTDFDCEDEHDHVPDAKKMYARINSDPNNQKFDEWKRKKGAIVEDPDLGDDTNDLTILSTAVHYLQLHPTELWTHDMDFTMFVDEIYETFGLRVVDTYRLGGRFL